MSVIDIKSLFLNALLDDFLDQVKGSGFSVDVDDYIVLSQCKEQFSAPDVTLEQIKFALSAIICRTEEEQKAFYQLFDIEIDNLKQKALEEENQKYATQIEIKKNQFKKTVVGLLVLIDLMLVVFFFLPVFKGIPYDGESEPIEAFGHFTTKDTLHYEAVNGPVRGFQNKKVKFASRQTLYQQFFDPRYDTTKLKVNWKINTTKIENKNAIQFHPTTFGKKKITIYYYFDDILVREAKAIINVCEPSPEIQLPDVIYAKEVVQFTAIGSRKKTVVWRINEDSITTTQDSVLKYTFPTAGSYTISCKTKDQQCSHNYEEFETNTSTRSLQVIDRDGFTLENNPSQSSKATENKAVTPLFLMLFLGLLVFLIGLSFILLHPALYGRFEKYLLSFFSKKNHQQIERYFSATPNPVFSGNKTPIDISFFNKNRLIKGKEVIRKLGLDLQKRIVSEETKLNFPKTIQASIRNADIISPIYDNKNVRRQYLALIDTSYKNSPLLKLFQFLVHYLSENQVDIDVYYFELNPERVYKKQPNDVVDLTILKNRYYQSALLVFSDGAPFLDYHSPTIFASIKKTYSFWNNRIVITPTPSKDWSSAEKIIASFFHIVPADGIGLLHIFSMLQKQAYDKKIKAADFATYTTKFIEFEDIQKLEDYCNNDRIFQWICCLALYPKINWEMILTLGEVVDSTIVTYENLLKISRIEWIQSGDFPTRIRLELLKKLTIENEINGRERIIELLEKESIVEADSFSKNEQKLQLIYNKFLLYAKDNVSYSTYKKEEQEFLKLYHQERFLDIPLKIYLEGKDPEYPYDQWESTLTSSPNKEDDNLKNYFNQQTQTVSEKFIKNKAQKILKTIISVATLFLLGLLSTLGYEYFNGDKVSLFLDKKIQIPKNWNVSVDNNDCFKAFNPTELTISNGNRVLSRHDFKKGVKLNFNNFDQIAGSNLAFTIKNEKGQLLENYFTIDSLQNTISIRGNNNLCNSNDTVTKPKKQIYLQYYPSRIKDSVAMFRDFLKSSNNEVADGLDYKKSTAKSEVRYFDKMDYRKATALANDASLFFDQKIEAVFVNNTNTNNLPIEIWIKKQLNLRVYSPIATSKIFSWMRLSKENFKATIVKTNSEQEDINYLAYNPKRVQLSEMKELASSLIQNKVNLKVIEPSSKMGNNDFELRYNSVYLNYQNLTTKDISNSIYKKKAQIPTTCDSKKVSPNNYVLYYEYDKFNITAQAAKLLDELVQELKNNPNTIINITGFAKQSSAAYDKKLSDRLSQSTSNYLISKGIPAQSIKSTGKGNSGYKNQQCFNRVEINIIANKPAVKGYLFYGEFDGKIWKSRYFKNAKETTKYPEVGDEIISINRVNVREREIQYLDNEGYVNQKIIGVIEPNYIAKVNRVIPVAGGSFVWIEFDYYP